MDEKIFNEMKKLKLEIYKIQCRNWLPSFCNGTQAAGITLEHALGKERNYDVLPDYNGIEIKTRSRYSNYSMGLFSCAFDNKPLESHRLLKLGGYPDKLIPEFKLFQTSINGLYWKEIRDYKYKLFVDYKKEKVKLLIYKRHYNIKITEMSWSFKELKKRLEYKLSYMAYITVIRDRVNGKVYFKYDDPIFYKLKGFDNFLKLIERGKICVTFRLSQNKTKELYGQVLDHGTNFNINIDNLEELFDKIEL